MVLEQSPCWRSSAAISAKVEESTEISAPPPEGSALNSPRDKPSTARVIWTNGRDSDLAIATARRIANKTATAPPVSAELLIAASP